MNYYFNQTMWSNLEIFVFLFQSNVIEAGAGMERESEKEWYFGNKEKERLGPYSFDEVNWIQLFY